MTTATAPIATPENTPIPGGGSWRWSATAPHWVSNEAAQPSAEPVAAQAATPPVKTITSE